MSTGPWRAGQTVTVSVPASSANLGPGFDSIGVGLEIRDQCTIVIRDEPGVAVHVTGEGTGAVPVDERHLVVRSLLRTWELLGVCRPAGLELTCVNRVPHGRGLGSSATAIVAGVSAAFALAHVANAGHLSVDLDAVNDIAAELEGHPDNSSASVFGGLTLSWTADAPAAREFARTQTVFLRPHPSIRPILLVPETALSTATARAVLPARVPLRDAAANGARAALLVHALTADPSLLLPGTRDWLHQEARRPSYAESMAIVDRLRSSGIAAAISGAGPSVLALVVGEGAGEVAAQAPSEWRLLDPGFAPQGVRVLGGNDGAPQ
ncbi:MAG: homoserine kinase [Tetrasphaera sp.]